MVDDGNLRYYHGDHLGSSNIITDASGTQIALYEYSPYGEVSHQSGTYQTNIKFTGKIQDDTGLYYYGARYYDPVIGRFISPDTIVQAPQDPQTLNRYAYARNNPVKYIDPTGHSWFKKFWSTVVSAVAGIAAFIGSGFNPIIGFQVFSWTNTGLNLGNSLVTGQGIGEAFGTFFASLAISAAFGGLGFHDITNLGPRMAAFAVEGAAIGAAGAAINDGDFGLSIGMGAGLGATMGFLSSEQFTNLRGKNGFITNKELAQQNAKIGQMAEMLGGGTPDHKLMIRVRQGHAGVGLVDPDGNGQFMGKYPNAGVKSEAEWLLGKTSGGQPIGEGGLPAWEPGGNLYNNFDTSRIYAINGVQAAMVRSYMNSPVGAFALTTNCTDWAVGAALAAGIYIPKSSYSNFGFADPSVLRKNFRE